MIQFDVITAGMCGLGLLLHFVSRWAEFWKTGDRLNPWAYATLDAPGWAFAALSAVAAYIVLPEVGGQMTPLWALTAGYSGSSIGAKLPAIFGKAGGVR